MHGRLHLLGDHHDSVAPMACASLFQDTTESACLRLFLDYHGLPLLWSWMADIGTADYSAQTQELKLLVSSVLCCLVVWVEDDLHENPEIWKVICEIDGRWY